MSKFYIDCEFDGHQGALLSFAIVHESGNSLYIVIDGVNITDSWVLENVQPYLYLSTESGICTDLEWVGYYLRDFLQMYTDTPRIIADSPVDIGRFCDLISTDEAGNWNPCGFDEVLFQVVNVDCYPTSLRGAIQHNALWDARALLEKLK